MSRVGSLFLLLNSSNAPYVALTSHRLINMHIRADKDNQLHLRAEMTDQDKEVIRAAGRNEDTYLARIVNEKMRREHIYGNIVQLIR